MLTRLLHLRRKRRRLIATHLAWNLAYAAVLWLMEMGLLLLFIVGAPLRRFRVVRRLLEPLVAIFAGTMALLLILLQRRKSQDWEE